MANATSSTQTTRRFIKRQQVETITGMSRTEIYRRVSAGTFPKQITLSAKSVVWIESEVLAWCDEQIAACRGEVA